VAEHDHDDRDASQPVELGDMPRARRLFRLRDCLAYSLVYVLEAFRGLSYLNFDFL
jgi:hypothetical protein